MQISYTFLVFSGAACKWAVSILVTVGYCSDSINGAMLGPVLPDLSSSRGYDVASLAMLVPAFSAGGSVGAACGWIFDSVSGTAHLPRGAVAVLAVVLTVEAAFAALMSTVHSREAMAFACFWLGCCSGLYRTGANWMMMRLHQEKAAPHIQMIHFSSGVGRFLSGMIASYFIHAKSLPGAFLSGALTLGVVAAPLAGIAVLYLQSDGCSSKKDKQGTNCKETVKESEPAETDTSMFVVLVSLFVFIVMGVQNSFQYLVTSYAVAASPPLNFSSTAKAALLSASYGAAFAASRLLSIPVSVKFKPLTLLQGCIALTVVALVWIMVYPDSTETLEWASAVLGLALAPAFPTAINYAKHTLGVSMSGSKLSMLMTSGTMGGIFLPQLAGQFCGEKGGLWGPPQVMMQLLCVTALSGIAVLMCATIWTPAKKKLKHK